MCAAILEYTSGFQNNWNCVGMVPIALDEDIIFATQLELKRDKNFESLCGNKIMASAETNGSMIMFCQPPMPDFYDEGGVLDPKTMAWRVGDYFFEAEETLLMGRRELPGYDKCDACYVKWVAESVDITEISKDINREITVQ